MERAIRRSIFIALLALVAGCGTDETDLTVAENFDRYRLYYLGDSFAGERLRHAEAGRYSLSFIYGDREAKSDSGCSPPLEVQIAPICDRNPVRNNVRAGYREIRGALADSGSPGGGVNLYTGHTTITIFRSKPFPIDEIVRSLRTVRGSLSANDDLPPPSFPRSMLRKLRRNKPREDPTFMRQLTALSRIPSAPC